MPAIVSIVGTSHSGKTTLIEKLIKELKARNYRVATVKHAQHAYVDHPGTDSWRHIQAGSEATILISHDRIVLIKLVAADSSLDELTPLLGEECDIILAEGFKQSSAAKIEVHRREAGPPLHDIEKLIAIATDEPLETGTRQFDLNDARGLVDFIEETFLKPRKE